MSMVVVCRRGEVIGESPYHSFLICQQLFAAKDIKGDGRKLPLLELGSQDEATNDQTLKFTHLYPPPHREEKIHVETGQHAGLPQDQLLTRLAHEKTSQSLSIGYITARMF